MNKHALVKSFSLVAVIGFGVPLVHAEEQSPLKFGMEITYPPFEYYDAENNIVGADPELAASIGKSLDRKVEFIDTKFLSLINGLNAGKYDAIISGMYITAERQRPGAGHSLRQNRISHFSGTGQRISASISGRSMWQKDWIGARELVASEAAKTV